MATLLLQAAGAFVGGALGFGHIGAAIGSAAGAMAGYMLDRHLIDSTRRIQGPRLAGMRPFTAEEGGTVPRVYGSARIAGTMIWATRFEEQATTTRQGGKGGPKVTTFSYFANVAFALCEGPIAGIRRVWADGRELDLTEVEMRIHTGAADQFPDPLIEAKQGSGNAPAYRGIAYVVFERLPIDDYGNRLPQVHVEVIRPVGDLAQSIRAVALLPGSTEFGLSPQPVRRIPGPGRAKHVNRHVLHAGSDFEAAMDELQMLCPNLEHVALVVTWFGDDLRAGQCSIRPAVTDDDPAGLTEAWSAAGQTRGSARVVSQVDGGPAYGGTPSDASVTRAIADLNSRGLKVTIHPFVMMDIAQANALPDPYGGSVQAAYPWRGRITASVALGLPGSPDKTAAIDGELADFLGNTVAPDPVILPGVPDWQASANGWGFRRLILHYAQLAAAAGGVDAFLLGSELRGLTILRDATDSFPFVQALRQLAGEVRAILGPQTKLTYGADWSEYFGYQPQDGSGDVWFHLDPLWADAQIDAIGIDNYMPLSDWRDADWAGGNPDGMVSPYGVDALRAAITGGEGYDWYYADQADRIARNRSAITDGAYGKDWVFRLKAVKQWWSNAHHDRPGGIEAAAPTAWQPMMKPVWFTELGCAAIDKGANQPNLFTDPKSDESASPHFSNGGRDDLAQRRFLRAHFGHWDPALPGFDAEQNPVSASYGGRMVDERRIYCWTWDVRPYPAFPLRRDVWSDGSNWLNGHWLNGRLEKVEVGDVIAAMLADHGLPQADLGGVDAIVDGIVTDAAVPAADVIGQLAGLFGLSVAESPDGLVIRSRIRGSEAIAISDTAAVSGPELQCERADDLEWPDETLLAFYDPFLNYQPAEVRLAARDMTRSGQVTLNLAGALHEGAAQAVLQDWREQARAGRETVRFAVPAARPDLRPGDLIQIDAKPGRDYVVEEVETGTASAISARRIIRRPRAADRQVLPELEQDHVTAPGTPAVALIDLPAAPDGRSGASRLVVGAFLSPWRFHNVSVSPASEGFASRAILQYPATMGTLATALPPGTGPFVENGYALTVNLLGGELESVSRLRLLNGANVAAVQSGSGWEVLQFENAEEISTDRWKLTGLIRGQSGTEDLMAAGAPAGAQFVLLDGAVIPAGLTHGEIGLELDWRVTPMLVFAAQYQSVTQTIAGGLRSLLTLAPVHLRAVRNSSGDIDIGWIRRSRVGGDSWIPMEIPLGEVSERYTVELRDVSDTLLASAETATPAWTWPAAEVAAAFPTGPVQFTATIRQIGVNGAGLPATRQFTFQ